MALRLDRLSSGLATLSFSAAPGPLPRAGDLHNAGEQANAALAQDARSRTKCKSRRPVRAAQHPCPISGTPDASHCLEAWPAPLAPSADERPFQPLSRRGRKRRDSEPELSATCFALKAAKSACGHTAKRGSLL